MSNPFQSFADKDVYPSIRWGFGFVKNHAFLDGNKRIGAHAMLVFLALNKTELNYTQKELSDIILEIASAEKGFADLCKWVISHQVE